MVLVGRDTASRWSCDLALEASQLEKLSEDIRCNNEKLFMYGRDKAWEHPGAPAGDISRQPRDWAWMFSTM